MPTTREKGGNPGRVKRGERGNPKQGKGGNVTAAAQRLTAP